MSKKESSNKTIMEADTNCVEDKMPMDCRILVVDDSPFIFKAVKRAVEPQGMIVVGQAFNGREGLELVERYQPDVIILDITMPLMNGLEMAATLLATKPQAKVIMLSAMGDDQLIADTKALGVKRFLTKPFEPDQIVAAIKSVME
jgi:two-component system, chemotaxis family, chemotaxis protein CheY